MRPTGWACECRAPGAVGMGGSCVAGGDTTPWQGARRSPWGSRNQKATLVAPPRPGVPGQALGVPPSSGCPRPSATPTLCLRARSRWRSLLFLGAACSLACLLGSNDPSPGLSLGLQTPLPSGRVHTGESEGDATAPGVRAPRDVAGAPEPCHCSGPSQAERGCHSREKGTPTGF